MSVKLVCAIWEFLGKGYVCLMCVLYLYVPRLEMHFQSAECAFSEQGSFFFLFQQLVFLWTYGGKTGFSFTFCPCTVLLLLHLRRSPAVPPPPFKLCTQSGSELKADTLTEVHESICFNSNLIFHFFFYVWYKRETLQSHSHCWVLDKYIKHCLSYVSLQRRPL